MAKIWKISEAASLAFHALALLASRPGEVLATGEIAAALKASEAHLSKVLQRLTKAGLVVAERGPRGGFQLEKDPRKITLLQVYEVIEGPIETVPCLFNAPICSGKQCILGGLMQTVNREIVSHLRKARVSEIAEVFAGMERRNE